MKALSFALVCGVLPALAAFPEARQNIRLDCGQRQATVVFKTDGAAIRKATPLCDCTRVQLNGTQLVATVDTSTFDADVQKQIDAVTEDGKRTRLTMCFEVPPAIVLSARSLIWPKGAAATPQVVTIRLPQGSPIGDIVDAGLSGTHFDFEPQTVKRGREYRLTVTPKTTEKSVLEKLVIKTDCADPRYAQRIIYLQVKAAK